VRALAASTVAVLLEGPTAKGYLALAEATDASFDTVHLGMPSKGSTSLTTGRTNNGIVEAPPSVASYAGGGRTSTAVKASFTSLSESLGSLIICTHAGLVASLAVDEEPAVLQAAGRALSALTLSLPVDRLPSRKPLLQYLTASAPLPGMSCLVLGDHMHGSVKAVSDCAIFGPLQQ
jgi:hypothetical protein